MCSLAAITRGAASCKGASALNTKGKTMAGIGEQVGQLLDALGVDRALWTEGSMPSVTPLTGEQLGMVQVVDGAAIDERLDAAAAAFRAWRHVPAPRRGELVRCGARNCARPRTTSPGW